MKNTATMTHEEAFLKAIDEDPDDNAPRLMYADWLEERGDPLGEFMRLQCELAAMQESDINYAPWKTQEEGLWEKHREVWKAKLMPPALRDVSLQLRPKDRGLGITAWMTRGTIGGLYIDMSYDRDAEAFHLFQQTLTDISSITEVSISQLQDRYARRFFALEALPRLRHLQMNMVSIPSIEAAATLPHLRTLRCTDTSASNRRVMQFINALPPLQELELNDMNIEDIMAQRLASNAKLCEVHTLALRDNQIGIDDAQRLIRKKTKLSALRTLDLRGNAMYPDDLEELRKKNMRNLQLLLEPQGVR